MISQPTCPICSKVIATENVRNSAIFPFCSERCRQVDLLRWSQGKYAIVEPLDPTQLEAELPDIPE
jgi:endogenous inhibitor of DNA gyrase (YacG/DUF329 family)